MHPEIGRQILEELGGVFHQLAEIVVAHHERWDGKGYPAGLKGEEIPIGARIISVVDAFDAILARLGDQTYYSLQPIVVNIPATLDQLNLVTLRSIDECDRAPVAVRMRSIGEVITLGRSLSCE